MNKKIIISLILCTLLAASLSSTSALAIETKNESTKSSISLVTSEISIDATPKIDAPLAPLEKKTIDVTVKFKLNIGKFAKWFFFNRRIGRLLLFGPKYALKFLTKIPSNALINLSVVECPDWCTATLDPNNITLGISNEFKEAEAKLTIVINNKTAPAFELKDVKIKAEFKGLGGIKASSNETNISLMPTYISKIAYDVEKEINITSTNETSIPINITNNGNGETIIKIEIENISENWNISIDPDTITIPVNKTRQVKIITTPTRDFDNVTIKVKLTTKSTYSGTDVEEKYLQGETVSFNITLINTQPPEEELPLFEILIAGVVIIILISVIAIMILIRKKKQQ
ncbi:MAG: hypothetical protein QHH19_06410 [Candidatus Thermoplasmatota archaeon]|nr:hypothetical protein [Candidatus Thermoplasmatota archaeon]